MTPPDSSQPGASRCPACGAAADGKFCPQCGTPQGPRPCPACGATLQAGARFCHRCGASSTGGAGAQQAATPSPAAASFDKLPWIAASILILLALAAIIWKVAGPSAPTPAGGGIGVAQESPGSPPDISQMSPMERFIRLNDRVMAAAEQGDSTTVVTFLPMALSAYQQLPEVDTDARYHAALLHVQVGDLGAARALADSILVFQPGNLLGLVLQGTLAELRGDGAGVADARRRLEAAWAAEIVKPNQEYVDHRNVLDAFRAGSGG